MGRRQADSERPENQDAREEIATRGYMSTHGMTPSTRATLTGSGLYGACGVRPLFESLREKLCDSIIFSVDSVSAMG
jgi:hypothetical protein